MLLQQKEVHYNESTRELAKVDLENVAIIN